MPVLPYKPRVTVPDKIILFLIAFYFLSTQAFSQFDKLKNYNVKDGLPGSDLYSIQQDSKGYIWITGDMGLSRFDGYKFKNLSTQEGLPDNTMFGLYEDKKNRLWLRSYSGKLAFIRNDSVHTLECNDTLRSFFKGPINNSIYVEGDTVWLGSTSGFIVKILPGWKNEHAVKIEMPGNVKYVYMLNEKDFLYGDHNHTGGTGTEIYNRQFKKLFALDNDIAAVTSVPRFFVKRLRNGNFCQSMNNVIVQYNEKGIVNFKVEPFTFIYLEEDSDGSIIACTTSGMKTYNGLDLRQPKVVQQLEGKVITGTIIDKEGEVWVTTEGHGVYSIPNRKFKYYTTENGLSESKITAIGKYSSSILAGHLDASLTLFSGDSIIPLSIQQLTNKFPLKRRINTILTHGSRTYIASSSGYYFENDRLVSLFDKEIPIKQFISSRDGTLWALRFGYLYKYSVAPLKEVMHITLPSRIDNMFEDSYGLLWMGGVDGVYTWDGKKLEKVNELLSQRVVDIKEDKQHRMWMATRGGGIIIKRDTAITQITEKDGLAGNMCRTVFIESDNIWVGTNKGLSKITEAGGKLKIENFYSTNGLLTNEVTAITLHQGKLWLTHNDGISIFEPDYLKNNTFSPPVYINQVLVNDSSVLPSRLSSLPHDQNYITIQYTGLCFKDAGNVEYKYKMEGIDSGWTYTRYTSVKYQTLPAGDYRFIVYAKNNDGYWGTTPGLLMFKISPAWWQTWWFRLIAGSILAALIIAVFKMRLMKIRARESEKSKLRQRVAETELHALRAQMNPHFIFNAINSVQYFITRNDPESSQRYLAKFARLIRYVVDNSKLALIPLKTELEALNLYLELESLRFEKKFEYKIDIAPSIDVNYIHIPSMIIQPYIENAIWHGLMHKKTQGKILIRIELNGDMLKCTIEDNGIGRKRSAELKPTTSSHKSLGMALTKERLDILNQVNNTHLNVMIHDLYDQEGEATGTRVELNIPLQ